LDRGKEKHLLEFVDLGILLGELLPKRLDLLLGIIAFDRVPSLRRGGLHERIREN